MDSVALNAGFSAYSASSVSMKPSLQPQKVAFLTYSHDWYRVGVMLAWEGDGSGGENAVGEQSIFGKITCITIESQL